MLLNVLDQYKLSTTKQTVTSFAGVPLFLGMAKSLGLEKVLNALPVKERARGYRPAESIFTLMGLLQSGGVALDDVSLMSSDEGLRALLGELPASNTLGKFLKRFTNRTIHQLGRIQLATAVKLIRACNLSWVTLDIDSFFLESQKSDVKMNYEGEWGCNPVAVTCAEIKTPVAGLFRAGNASPMGNLAGLMKRVLVAMKGMKIRFRSDSAGFQAGVVRVLREAGADYTITARKDAAVMETIRSIPAGSWKRYEGGVWEDRATEIAETVHAFGDADVPAQRMIAIRWRKKEPDLFQDPHEYHAVVTSFDDWAAGVVMQFHRTRQDGSENVNKELSGGIGLSKLPCRLIQANAAHFQVALLAYTVFAATRQLALPESWQKLTIKTVRFRLIRLAGMVARRSRSVWLKLSTGYLYRQEFEDARERILGLSAELSYG